MEKKVWSILSTYKDTGLRKINKFFLNEKKVFWLIIEVLLLPICQWLFRIILRKFNVIDIFKMVYFFVGSCYIANFSR